MSALQDSIEQLAHRLSMHAEEGLCMCYRDVPCGMHEVEGPVGSIQHHANAFLVAAMTLDTPAWHRTVPLWVTWGELATEYAERTAPAWDTSPEAMSPLVLLP